MSYTSQVKDEILEQERSNIYAISFLSGFVRNNYYIKDNYLFLSIYNDKLKNKLINMFNNLYHIKFIIEENNKNNNFISKYTLKTNEKIDFLLESLGVIDTKGKYLNQVPEYIISDEDLKKEYIKGCFISCGSINDPKTSKYHLELLINNKFETVKLQSLINYYELNSKIIDRNNRYMIYIKEAEKICDFIKVLGANKSVLYYENIIIYHEKKNQTNRLNNCEQANVDKTIQSSQETLDAIEKIENNNMLDILDESDIKVIEYRKKYRESSLKELANKMSKKENRTITKSYLNHKFRKIRNIASNIVK